MARVGWLRASLIALLPASIAISACADDPLETCGSPAACATEQQDDELGAGPGSGARHSDEATLTAGEVVGRQPDCT